VSDVPAGDSTAIVAEVGTDNDPLYRFHQWQANLRLLDVVEIKTVPFVPYPIRLWSASWEPYVENAWTEHYSGRPPTWRRSFSRSEIISTVIVLMPDCKDVRQNPVSTNEKSP
jgi:hypothetical protein